MQVYSVHIRRHGLDVERDFVVIKEGFSWPAFLFNAFWALWHRQWLVAAAMIIVLIAIIFSARIFGGTAAIEFVICGGWFLAVGMLANDIRRYDLDRAGFVEVGESLGRTQDEALYSYLIKTSPNL